MPKLSRLFLSVLCAGAILSSSALAEDSLKVGDAAPALSVSKFVKGDKVEKFEKGKIYVVEFWATWCPPCRESIPHLTEMQKTYKDVTFVGVDQGEDEATVTPFVTTMGEKMVYSVAVDKDGATSKSYMEAAGQNGIPTAFIVNKDSNVAWIGHPMSMEPVLKQVVAGTYDPKKAATSEGAMKKVIELAKGGDLDAAIKKADQIIASDPDQAGTLGVVQFQMIMLGQKDPIAAAKKADAIASKVSEPQALNMMAWSLVTATQTTPETLNTAQKLSEMSLEKLQDSAECLDTLARVYAVKKDFKKAIELENKAIANCKDDKMKDDLNKSLEAYKKDTVPAAE